MSLLEEGRTNGEIAQILGVSFPTAKTHVSNILAKLGVGSREEAVAAWHARRAEAPRRGAPIAAPIVALLGIWRPVAVACSLVALVIVGLVVIAALLDSEPTAPSGLQVPPPGGSIAIGPHAITDTTGLWVQTLMTSASVDNRPGIYVWTPRAGSVERWHLPSESAGGYGISDDGRWVTGAAPLGEGAEFHLLDRTTGRSWSWPDDPLILMEASRDRVAIRTRNLFDWGTLYVLDASMELVEAIPAAPVPVVAPGDVSPDKSLVAHAIPLTGRDADGEIGARWAGVIVDDATTGNALFRVRGSLGPGLRLAQSQWLADSSGIVITTGAVPEPGADSPRFAYVVVSRDGSGSAPLPFQASPPGAEVAPSPVDRDVFAIGRRRYLNLRTGEDYSLTTSFQFSLFPSAWSADGTEIRWAISGGGHGSGLPVVLPSLLIEFPPFPDTLRFQVARAAGCAQLREAPDGTSSIVGCVPNGSALELAPGEDGLSVAPSGTDWSVWARVRSLNGQEGWVSGDYLDWSQ